MDITGSNANLTIAISSLFPIPQTLQGFAADDVYDFDEIENVETLMGVDGILSGGWTWKPQVQTIIFQADSPSCAVFDTWNMQMAAANTVYPATGVLTIPALGLKMVQTTGFLTRYKLPGVKKLVQPRRFAITWGRVVPARA